MENIVYKTEIELKGCTLEEFNELRNRLYGTVTEKIELSPYYQQKTKEKIFLSRWKKRENIFRNFAIMRMEKEIALLW